MITLNGLQLPEGLLLDDEFSGSSRVRMSMKHSQGGTLFIQKKILKKGKEITLQGGQNHGFMRRDLLRQLKALSELGATHTLSMHNGDIHQIKFRYPNPISATLIKLKQNPDDADLYNNVVIRMLEV